MSFRGGGVPGPNDVFIAVMGVTGSGKSSFISACSGRPVKIGHSLGACTSTVDVYAYVTSPHNTVYLIDTPGFDDTNRSDTEVLREIAAWLGESYENSILLNGIIYLHRITDIRMQGSAKKNLILFKQLCGQDALKKVILVTPMWDKVLKKEGSSRGKELINTPEFWSWMLGKGSSTHRHDNTEASARSIVNQLASHHSPITTDIQRQLVDERLTLDQTSAGQELQGELLREKAKWAKERKEIEQHMRAAIQQRDRETEKTLREERDRYTKMIRKVEDDTGTLRSTMTSLLAERDKRVSRMEQQLRDQQSTYETELKHISDRQRKIEQEKMELEKQQRQREREDKEREETERQRQKEREQEEQRRLKEKPAQVEKHNIRTFEPIVFAPYCISLMGNGFYMCMSSKCYTMGQYPKGKRGSSAIRYATYGELSPGIGTPWIAGYSDGVWVFCRGHERAYPKLDADIRERGWRLDMCVLGPGGSYFVRWQDGFYRTWASPDINTAIRDAQSNGNSIKAMSLRYGGSYIISYGSGKGYTGLSGSWSLKNHYSGISRDFLKTVSIQAITLNMQNTTDFSMVYTKDNDKSGTVWFQKHCSESHVGSSLELRWQDV
ncbi:hypothetical protein BJX99DRAFT_86652 [Aspergillus californicus]